MKSTIYQKQKLDYFPHYCDTGSNEKYKCMIWEIGLIAKAIVFDIFELIYGSNNGYYLQTQGYIITTFCRERKLELQLFEDVVKLACSLNIFDADLYEKYKILTGERIQKEYLNKVISLRRLRVDMIKEFVLVDVKRFEDKIKNKQTEIKIIQLKDTDETGTMPQKKVVHEANESQEVIDSRFDEFWQLYDYKTNKEVAKKLFNQLTKKEIKKVFETLPAYLVSAERRFRKTPDKYLRMKKFNDEDVVKVYDEKIREAVHKSNMVIETELESNLDFDSFK